MKEIALTCLLGIVVGAVDVLPMIKRKMDRYSVVSAYHSEHGAVWDGLVAEGRGDRDYPGASHDYHGGRPG